MKIDCTTCTMYESRHCEDCLVTAMLRPSGDVVDIDEELEEPLRALSDAGLVPVLRFRPRPGPAPPGEPRGAAPPAAEADDPDVLETG